jgi:hypothetical protein
VWRLQRGSDADCVFFQHMVNGGRRILDAGSRQGLWVCAPSGKVLAHVNSRRVEDVVATLARGRAAWDELEPRDRHVPERAELEPAHRWEQNYPVGGLVLERIARDLAPGGLDAAPMEGWNRDFAWFTAAEVRAFLPVDLAVGEVVELPLIAARLARFHLVDNVRGQTLPFADPEIRSARLSARAVRRDGDELVLELEGATRAVAEGPWLLGDNSWKPFHEHRHEIETELIGRATFDVAAARFSAFELVGLGRFRGRTVHNARRGDDPTGLVAFHLGLARDEVHVAPTFLSLYGADWVRLPPVPTWRATPAECGLDGG